MVRVRYGDWVPPDATATKARILTAGVEEFAQFGLAGARVDRIAESAAANKRSIYAHFGNKADLFDVVVTHALSEMAQTVPFTADDLGDYAGRLFDYLLRHPSTLRLTVWAQLERSEASRDEIETYRPKVAAIAAAQQAGVITNRRDPADLLALVVAIATSWANASPALRTLAAEPDGSAERLAGHREALVAAVHAVTSSPDR
ncbi:TetR family transcriptional regulator [Gordonia sp. NPDC003376]